MAKDDIYILTEQGSFADIEDPMFGAKGQLVRQVDDYESEYSRSFVLLCPRPGQCATEFGTSPDRMKPLQGGSES